MGFFGYLDRVRYKFAQDARRLHGMNSREKTKNAQKGQKKRPKKWDFKLNIVVDVIGQYVLNTNGGEAE